MDHVAFWVKNFSGKKNEKSLKVVEGTVTVQIFYETNSVYHAFPRRYRVYINRADDGVLVDADAASASVGLEWQRSEQISLADWKADAAHKLIQPDLVVTPVSARFQEEAAAPGA